MDDSTPPPCHPYLPSTLVLNSSIESRSLNPGDLERMLKSPSHLHQVGFMMYQAPIGGRHLDYSGGGFDCDSGHFGCSCQDIRHSGDGDVDVRESFFFGYGG